MISSITKSNKKNTIARAIVNTITFTMLPKNSFLFNPLMCLISEILGRKNGTAHNNKDITPKTISTQAKIFA